MRPLKTRETLVAKSRRYDKVLDRGRRCAHSIEILITSARYLLPARVLSLSLASERARGSHYKL